MKSFVLFILGTLAFGAVSLGVGYAIWGTDSLLQGAVAFGLTAVPATITLAWVIHNCRSAPEMQLLASMGGTGVRLAVAAGGGLLLTQTQPEVFDRPFWTWLIVFYLVLLGFEITLLVRQQPKPNG